MRDPNTITPPAAVLGLVTGMWAAKATAVAANLGIPDQLALGPKTAEEVAKAIGADASAVYRLRTPSAPAGLPLRRC